jgi:hypothetical protein
MAYVYILEIIFIIFLKHKNTVFKYFKNREQRCLCAPNLRPVNNDNLFESSVVLRDCDFWLEADLVHMSTSASSIQNI